MATFCVKISLVMCCINFLRFQYKSHTAHNLNSFTFFANVAVKHVRKDERRYYEDLLKYSMDHLMLFPYHLSDIIVKGLRVTPFSYYQKMMHNIMSSEKSYDSLPNFTAADCKHTLVLNICCEKVDKCFHG